jgi:hypothetical protein
VLVSTAYAYELRRGEDILSTGRLSGVVRCARCGELILRREFWDLGNVDETERTVYSGPEHRRCNRATETHKRQRKWSRQW